MAEDVWILGIRMTKFGKHPDKDSIDLATEAAMGAPEDGCSDSHLLHGHSTVLQRPHSRFARRVDGALVRVLP